MMAKHKIIYESENNNTEDTSKKARTVPDKELFRRDLNSANILCTIRLFLGWMMPCSIISLYLMAAFISFFKLYFRKLLSHSILTDSHNRQS